MTAVAIHPDKLKSTIAAVLGDKVRHITVALEEVTVEISATDYLQAMQLLRDAPNCKFEQLVDLCGVDYSTYGDREQKGLRYCVVSHLLSVSLNQRLRVKVFCADDDFPVLPTLTDLWNGANWYEREAFDCMASCLKGMTTCVAS